MPLEIFLPQLSKLLKSSTTILNAFISKIPNPESFRDFRPISLVNFSFKIFTKIMVARLTTIPPNIISHYKVAYVGGHSIYDHIALAHEPRLKQKLNSASLSPIAWYLQSLQ